MLDSERLTRARQIVSPWVVQPTTVGAYITGSAVRPYFDEHSDLDLVVVVDDKHYATLRPQDRISVGIDRGPPRRKVHELQLLPASEDAARATRLRDQLRFSSRHVVTLHDPSGQIAAWHRAAAELPSQTRDERLRVHYGEYLREHGKGRVSLERGHVANAQIAKGRALTALVKCLFMAAGSWVPKLEWALVELRELAVPADLVDRLEWVWLAHDVVSDDVLHERVARWFTELGLRVHETPFELTRWMSQTDEGRAAVEKWFTTP